MTAGMDVALTSKMSINGSVAATYQRAVDKTNKASQSYDNQLPYTPRWSGSCNVVLTMPWFNIGYSVVMQGERYSMEQNKPEYRMHAFWEHSMVLSRSFKFGGSLLEVSLKATNFTDTQYEIIKYYPMPGREWIASMTWHI